MDIREEEPYKFTVNEAMADRFREGMEARSAEYNAGFLHMLRRKIEGANLPPLPYQIGTAQADAYFSGRDDANNYLKHRQYRGQPLFD